MERGQVELLREVLEGTGWLERTGDFARALRTNTRSAGGLLLLGTEADEPWHFTAHLDDESRYAGIPEIAPTLVRWAPPPGAPAHLSVGLDRLIEARRGESLLVVAESFAPAELLERVSDARRKGAGIFALDTGDRELQSLASEVLTVNETDQKLVNFDGTQHLVAMAAGAPIHPQNKGFRARLGRILDVISGPSD